MPRPLRLTLRCLIVLGALTVLSVALPVSPRSGPTPYVSALSDITAPPAFAAGCQNKRCTSGGVRGEATCVANTGTNCHIVNLGGGLKRCDPDTTC